MFIGDAVKSCYYKFVLWVYSYYRVMVVANWVPITISFTYTVYYT